MIGFALQFLSGKIVRAFAWATQSLTHILIVALVASLAWGWLGHHNAAKWRKVLASTVIAWKAAEREATAAQIAANSAQQARWAQQARNVDDDYQKARVDADSRSERFIRSGGLRCPANPRSPGGGDPVQSPNPATGIDGAGEAPVLVAVAPDDVRICSENTTRLQAAREWALALDD